MLSMRLRALSPDAKIILGLAMRQVPLLKEEIEARVVEAQTEIARLDSHNPDFRVHYDTKRYEIEYLQDFLTIFTIDTTT